MDPDEWNDYYNLVYLRQIGWVIIWIYVSVFCAVLSAFVLKIRRNYLLAYNIEV